MKKIAKIDLHSTCFIKKQTNKDILKQQLKKFRKEFVNSFAGVPCVCKVNLDNVEFYKPEQIEQFLTDFYHKIVKEEQKSKIIAIEKKMLKDKSFIDELVELKVKAEREKKIEYNPRQFGKNTKALLEFFFEGKRGKAIIFATPEGNFLSPKAVENKLKAQRDEIIKDMDKLSIKDFNKKWNCNIK